MNEWIAASRELQERLLPLAARLQMSEADVLRGELDVLLGRLQQPLDAALVAMATSADVDEALAVVETFEPRLLCALGALWAHHNVRWHARMSSPAGAPWMPDAAEHVWRAVLIALIHDGDMAQRTRRILWPLRDAARSGASRVRLLPREALAALSGRVA